MNVFKKLSTCLAIIMLLFCVNALPTSAHDSPFHNIDHFMDELMMAHIEESHIPNATISIVSDGDIIYEQGFGNADLTNHIEVKPDKTLFRIGSISKLFTWTAVMQLVEQGQLDLHTDVNEYIDFKIPNRIENDTDGKDPEPITLHHLMTHTPGFEDYSDAIFRLSESDFLPLEDYVQAFLPKRVFPAGDVIAYSNYGTVLAGYIVEHVSGMDFSDYIDEHIFSPLGMTQSTFQQPVPE